MSEKTGPSINRHGSKQDYATPLGLIRAIEIRFGPITFDLAASETNAKAARFYAEAQDSLKQDWHKIRGGSPLLFLNPPFADIQPWAAKCEKESLMGARIILLVPASVGSNWFADHVLGKSQVLALNPRISFDGENAYPKDLLVCAFGFGKRTFGVWHWK